MKLQDEDVSLICGLYANKWHLATMLIPLISKKIEKGEIITTILEETIEDEIKQLLQKINITKEEKTKIQNIGWIKSEKINEEQINVKDKKLNVIITGNKENIDKNNKSLLKLLNKNIIKNKYVNIINLYEIEQINDINEILKKYDYIINTSGIHQKEEIYPNEKNKEAKIS